jgi:hypothetical protein
VTIIREHSFFSKILPYYVYSKKILIPDRASISLTCPEDGMNVRITNVLLPALALAAFLIGCGGASKEKMEEIQNRIKSLTEKGTPDSVLANVKVYQYNVAAAQKLNNAGEARAFTDSMLNAIAAAEKWQEDMQASSKAFLESKGAELKNRKAKLTGLQVRPADSMFVIIDSLEKKSWLVQARAKMEKLDSMMAVLENDEKIATEIRTKIVGKWGDAHWIKAEDANYKAFEKKVFSFSKDGKFEGSEEMKGQTTEFMKEDWQFLSWGNYEVKGDTIFIFVNREKCPRQIFTQWWTKEAKWKEDKKPTYDSTITNGAKNRFILFKEIKSDFKKM